MGGAPGEGTAGRAVSVLAASSAPGVGMAAADGRGELDELRRMLHDTTLQMLEYIARGGRAGRGARADELMQVAAIAASELRERLECAPHGEPDLLAGVRRVVREARRLGEVDIEVAYGPVDETVPSAQAQALCDALREALTNVRKHACAGRAIVYCEAEDGRALVTVRDDGVGLDESRLAGGFGIPNSILGRMATSGGWARLERLNGSGTMVVLGIGPEVAA